MELRNIYIRTLCVFGILVLFPPGVFIKPVSGVSFIRNVGQDVVFMWNRTSPSIFEAQWGSYDHVQQFIKPSFIYINKFDNVAVPNNDLDTPAASRYKGRVFWVGDLAAGRAWFKITNLNINDTNQYGVRLQDGTGVNKIYTIDLIVTVFPSFPHFPTSPYLVDVIEGRDLVINCTAIGPPTPTVQWFASDGTPITSASVTGTVTLTKRNVRRSHNGTKYKCVASNNPNNNSVSTYTIIKVVVLFPPNNTIIPPSITVVRGDVILFSCTADGNPPPSISWTKAGGVIKAGHTVAGGTLRIPDAIKTDAGKYVCTAKNTYDSRLHTDVAKANAVVVFPPGPVNITSTEVEASSITVRWTKPADDGGSPVTGYLLEVSTKPPVITVNTHAVIAGLKANTQYTVRVYAQNAVGYGVVCDKVIGTKKIGKPAVPEIMAALLEALGSKLSVVLRWEEPNGNGGSITGYTIYTKEVPRKVRWTKYVDVNSNRLEYRITKNIVYGKTYMFMVTAWNKYGESVKDERGTKILNTTATKARANTHCIEEGSKLGSTVLGVIIAVLVLSLGFNILQFLYLRRKVHLISKGRCLAQNRKTQKKAVTGESYDNDLESENNTTSRTQQSAQTGPEYETIQRSNPNVTGSSDDTRNYQELNLLATTSIQGTHGPVYEPIRTRSVGPNMQNNNEQHPYEPLNIRNQNTTYQSLQANSTESAI